MSVTLPGQVAVVMGGSRAVSPGFMRTERVRRHLGTDEARGQLLASGDLASRYGIDDVDGRFVPRHEAL